MRIIVSGVVAGVPDQGGAAWAVLQWVLGLRHLGHDVILIEQVDAGRLNAVAPAFTAIAAEYGLDGRAALVERGTSCAAGLTRDQLLRLARGADLVLNISGSLDDPELLAAAQRRVFVDLDPAFTQLWDATKGVDLGLDAHEAFVTVGLAIGTPGCAIPTAGRTWLTTVPPIVLDHWPVAGAVQRSALTSVGHWRSYGSIHHDGVHFGQRAHSLRPLIDLPSRVTGPFALALGIHPDEREDLDALRRHGWHLIDPGAVAATPAAYRDFVRGSWAELGVAKLGYVASRCGWFSDRSLCYLASGRPVVAQDTGFSEWLATGEGLLAFDDGDQAAEAIETIRGDYRHHRRAARALAEEVFDSDRVLGQLISCL
jgi:hypothetical protein